MTCHVYRTNKYGGSSNWVTPTYTDVTALWTTMHRLSQKRWNLFWLSPQWAHGAHLKLSYMGIGHPVCEDEAAGPFALDTTTYLTSSGRLWLTSTDLLWRLRPLRLRVASNPHPGPPDIRSCLCGNRLGPRCSFSGVPTRSSGVREHSRSRRPPTKRAPG